MPHISPNAKLDQPAFIHDTALIFGDVRIAKGVSVWPYAVMRAEMEYIEIGEKSNIQDFVMIHFGSNEPTVIGRECSITHQVTLHGCRVGDYCLIGINSVIMDGAVIGANSIVAGNSIVTEGTEFPPNSIIAGSPARVIKTSDNSLPNRRNALFYYLNALNYAKGIDRLSAEDIAQYQNG